MRAASPWFRATVVGLGAVLCALTIGCSSPTSFQFLGTAHYDGKRFRDTEGQFEGIALSPAGDRVAFRGRERLGIVSLFVADLDGLTRLITATGPNDSPVAWSGDGNSLFFLDTAGHPYGPYTGAVIQQHTLSTRVVRPAVMDVPSLDFFPSPDGAMLLVSGASHFERLTLDQTRNRIHTLSGGTHVTIAPDRPTLSGNWAASWSPEGGHVAIAPRTDGYDGPVTVVILKAPEWRSGQTEHKSFTSRYTAMAWEDASVLRVVDVTAGDTVTLTRLGTEGQVLSETTVALGAPPAGARHWYGRPILSRDGRRVLVTRQVSHTEMGIPNGVRQTFVVDDKTMRPLPATEDLEPIGWSGNERVLCLNGAFQRRRPVVLDVPPATP